MRTLVLFLILASTTGCCIVYVDAERVAVGVETTDIVTVSDNNAEIAR